MQSAFLFPPLNVPGSTRSRFAAEYHERPPFAAAGTRSAITDHRKDISEKQAASPVIDLGTRHGKAPMTVGTILLILLIILLIGALPAWPYSRGWGYAPGGVIGTILVILLILLLLGYI
jgi:hypothetical protein